MKATRMIGMLAAKSRWAGGVRVTLFCLLCLLATTAHAVVSITTNTLIDVGDTTYDGQDIVVNNCTLTVNGQHAFGSLQAVNNAVVTHAAATTNQTYSLQMTLTSNLVVDASSKIDVTGRGFLPGYTLGNTTVGGTTGNAGGSYGG